MIRIKDTIFNENEIEYIMQFTEKELQVMFKDNNDIYVDGTFDDIEWNYQEIDNIKRVMKSKEDACQRIVELEKENKKLKFAMQDTYDSANDTCGELQQRIKELEEENKRLKATTKYNYDITI